MLEKRRLTCVVCPKGCALEVAFKDGQVSTVEGNSCSKGLDYAVSECVNPVRTLTTTVKVKNGQFQVAPVKSEKPLPKGILMDCMKVVDRVEITAPVNIGDVIIKNILNTGIDLIATKNINCKEG